MVFLWIQRLPGRVTHLRCEMWLEHRAPVAAEVITTGPRRLMNMSLDKMWAENPLEIWESWVAPAG